MQDLLQHTRALWASALDLWIAGGWCMPPIALTALLLFGLGIHIAFKLRAKTPPELRDTDWQRLVQNPDQAPMRARSIVRAIALARTLPQLAATFAEMRVSEIAPFDRDMRVMRICISAAPLLGLLGTVTGMLTTFQALAVGSGGEQTMGLVAKGISEALITTETGLVVALPGLFFQYLLARRCDRIRARLAHVETVCTQDLYRRLRPAPALARVG